MDLMFIKKICLKYRIVLGVILTLLTCFIYMFNTDPLFQIDSESLVVAPMYAVSNDMDIDNANYGLGKFETFNTKMQKPKTDSIHSSKEDKITIYYNSFLMLNPNVIKEKYEYVQYKSQIGLQGVFFSLQAKLFHSASIYKALRFICCLTFIVLSYFIAIELQKKYGITSAIVYWLVLISSSWLQNFAPNLYWVMFTWFVPMLLGLLCINHKKKKKYIYPFFFIAIFVKCLCGYEYLSTIMISGIAFSAAEWFIDKKHRKEHFKCILTSGLYMLAGFILAFLLHAYIYGGGNIIEGIKGIKHYLIDRRTFGDAANFDIFYSDSLNASVLDVLKKYLWTFPLGRKMLYLFLISSTSALLQIIIFKRKSSLYICMLISFAGTLSWFILGKSHSYEHTHINFVLYYMGFCQLAFCVICEVITSHIKINTSAGNNIFSKIRLVR